jgi:hypothetical protein
MTYGYRYGEVPLPALTEIKAGTEIRELPCDTTRRPPVAISLGPHAQGIALPHPCPADRDTMLAGAAKRFATKPPTPELSLLKEYTEFVDQWLEKNLVPLTPDVDTSVETWLKTANYPDWRKQELQAKYDKLATIWDDPKFTWVKSFMKDEGYACEGFKHARGINSRTDEYKCAVGPIFHLIEKELFQHPAFIKKVPVKDRAAYIMEMLYREGATYMCTDYTAYEAHFTKIMMMAGEFRLYKYMTQFLPEKKDFDKHMDEVLSGTNRLTFKFFIMWIEATRMSGEMCTSLGNGFSNLMSFLFACKKAGGEGRCVVEGDDCVGDPGDVVPTAEFFKRMGLTIKLEKVVDIARASFCGLIFDPVELQIVTDPKKVLASFGWTSNRYAKAKPSKFMELLRCKALSLASQYPACPIVTELAHFALRVTKGTIISPGVFWHLDTYQREKLLRDHRCRVTSSGLYFHVTDITKREPGLRSRVLVEEMYGITIAQQHELEHQLQSKVALTPIDVNVLDFPESWSQYYQWYALNVQYRTDRLDDPGALWVKRPGFVKEW